MKQISIAVSIMVLCIFLSLFSSGQKKLVDSLRHQNSLLKLQLQHQVNLQIQHQDLPCNDCNKYAFTGISNKTATELFLNYSNYISRHNLKTDSITQSVWFSLDSLKAFICAIEAANNNNCDKKLSLGVRIYFGKYPNWAYVSQSDNSDYNSLPPSYTNHNTLFLVPTYTSPTDQNENIDFDPLYMGNNKCVPTPLYDLLPHQQIAALKNYYPLNDTATVTVLVPGDNKNHGDLIPPTVTKTSDSFIGAQ